MRNIAVVYDHFRLMNIDQFDGLARACEGKAEIVGIELYPSHADYPFGKWSGSRFRQIVLFSQDERDRIGSLRTAWRIVRECRAQGVGTVFISHYERPYIFLASLALRLLGRRIFVIQDTKFDDRTRHLWREALKRILYWPYHGAIAASPRSADYVRFLGVDPGKIRLNCYTTSIERVRADAGVEPAPRGTPYGERNFICVARLIPKKNHATLIAAFALYAARAARPRRLILCGSGPCEADIRSQIADLGLGDLIELKGNVGAVEVARELGAALCLLLPSIEEQYGIVVIEAQAMGLPVILSDSCGARDVQVRSGVNGFVVEPDNVKGLAYFMQCLGEDEALWRRMSQEAIEACATGDTGGFVEAALSLLPANIVPRG